MPTPRQQEAHREWLVELTAIPTAAGHEDRVIKWVERWVRRRAHLKLRRDAAGNVIGEPRITRRSGNPWYDDGVTRAIRKASPLPAPPEAGRWPFIFMPEDSY